MYTVYCMVHGEGVECMRLTVESASWCMMPRAARHFPPHSRLLPLLDPPHSGVQRTGFTTMDVVVDDGGKWRVCKQCSEFQFDWLDLRQQHVRTTCQTDPSALFCPLTTSLNLSLFVLVACECASRRQQ